MKREYKVKAKLFKFVRCGSVISLFALLTSPFAFAQLPADSVDLSKVNIPERIKSFELCPVHNVPVDPKVPAWNYQGVNYGGDTAACQAEFEKDPERYARQARFERYLKNYISAMSGVWCPVTDEVTPGGLLEWNVNGIHWESCCAFCDQSVSDEDFPKALERLKERAKKSFELTDGKYTEGAKSPTEGAIKAGAEGAAKGDMKKDGTTIELEPAWMKGKDLKPTYKEGIGLIFEHRCVECHHPGAIAPMSFASYEEIKGWTKSMKKTVVNRNMPPWPADLSVGKFSNNRALTQKEIDLISKWADTGFPAGEGSYTPEIQWGEWTIGKPDQEITINSADATIDCGALDNLRIIAMEIHVPDFPAAQIDIEPLVSYYPGNWVHTFPQGMGRLLKKEDKIKAHVSSASAESAIPFNGAKVGLRWAKDAAFEAVEIDRMANADFTIPAGAENFEAKTKFEFKQDGKIVSLMPILMNRGKDVSYSAIFPDGKKQELLKISHWDPDWKLRYELATSPPAPKGTIVEMTAHYDNSKLNAKNPNAGVDVKAGPQGELCEGWIEYTNSQ